MTRGLALLAAMVAWPGCLAPTLAVPFARAQSGLAGPRLVMLAGVVAWALFFAAVVLVLARRVPLFRKETLAGPLLVGVAAFVVRVAGPVLVPASADPTASLVPLDPMVRGWPTGGHALAWWVEVLAGLALSDVVAWLGALVSATACGIVVAAAEQAWRGRAEGVVAGLVLAAWPVFVEGGRTLGFESVAMLPVALLLLVSVSPPVSEEGRALGWIVHALAAVASPGGFIGALVSGVRRVRRDRSGWMWVAVGALGAGLATLLVPASETTEEFLRNASMSWQAWLLVGLGIAGAWRSRGEASEVRGLALGIVGASCVVPMLGLGGVSGDAWQLALATSGPALALMCGPLVTALKSRPVAVRSVAAVAAVVISVSGFGTAPDRATVPRRGLHAIASASKVLHGWAAGRRRVDMSGGPLRAADVVRLVDVDGPGLRALVSSPSPGCAVLRVGADGSEVTIESATNADGSCTRGPGDAQESLGF